MPVHLQLRLEGHAADGARRRRVHALVHSLDVDVHAIVGFNRIEIGYSVGFSSLPLLSCVYLA